VNVKASSLVRDFEGVETAAPGRANCGVMGSGWRLESAYALELVAATVLGDIEGKGLVGDPPKGFFASEDGSA